LTLFILTTCLTSYFIVYLAIKFAWKINFLSHPNTIFVAQKKPVAYLGGLAIYLAIVITTIFNPFFIDTHSPNITNALLIMFFFTAIGLIDDWMELRPATKLLAQILGAAFALYLDFTVEFTKSSFLNSIVSGFILIFTVNAFNLVDVSDGLLSALFISVLSFFYFLSGNDHFLIVVGISVACFLFFNRPDARIYLGDSGSHLLGALAYILSIDYLDNTFNLNNIIPLTIVFSVIIFEFLFMTLAYISISYSITVKLVLTVFTICTFFLFGYLINKLSNEKT